MTSPPQKVSTLQGLHRRTSIPSPRSSDYIHHSSRSSSSANPSSSSSSSSSSTSSNSKNRKQPTASDFYVPSLPGQPSDSKLILYSGHLPFSRPDSNIEPEQDSYGFFFLNKARHIANRPVLLVWLNGGPGCSSFDGSLMEVGPLRMILKGKGNLKEVDGAWNEYANMLFIDQPTGTGYSYGPKSDYVHELDVSSNNLVNFLARFFKIFPEYSKMDLYICGESFAGQYIPYLAQAILDTNVITAPLKGIIIGNGWIDPPSQYLAYPEFAFRVGLVDRNSKSADMIHEEFKKCNKTINALVPYNIPIHIPACEGILSAITDSTVQTVNSQKMCLNMYDVRLVDKYPECGLTWPPDLMDITPYLSRNDVKIALHAQNHKNDWVECEARVGNNFWAKTSKPSIHLFPKLLSNIKILLFSGDQDLICCHDGTERMIDNLNWGGHKGWTSAASSLPWKVNGTYAGLWREERNLTYALIANASHMAPYDVPLVTQDMLVRFLEIDVISAAGPAAQISSKIGSDKKGGISDSRVVTLNDTKSGTLKSLTKPELMTSSSSTNTSLKDEGDYNSSSAIIFLGLIGLVIGLIFFIRRRLRINKTGSNQFDDSSENEMILKNDLNGQSHPDRSISPPSIVTSNTTSNHHHQLINNPSRVNQVHFQPIPTDDDLEDDSHLLNPITNNTNPSHPIYRDDVC